MFLVGIEPVCGFVEDQDIRIVQNGLRKADAPLEALALSEMSLPPLELGGRKRRKKDR